VTFKSQTSTELRFQIVELLLGCYQHGQDLNFGWISYHNGNHSYSLPVVMREHTQVAAGVGQMLFLVDSESETVKKLAEFHPEVEVEPSKEEDKILGEASGKGEQVTQAVLTCCDPISAIAKRRWHSCRMATFWNPWCKI